MSDLLTLMRENDLPPKWDGRVVRWDGWRDLPAAFICPPPRERDVCPACGSAAERVTNRGLVALNPATTLDRIANYEQFHKTGKVAHWRLYAYRCVDCKHDQIWDSEWQQLWDLDSTDYGNDGSRA